MLIREMSREECLRWLSEARLARLACSHENQPYIVPVYLTYHQSPGGDPCFYGFTTLGQKLEWMRVNPLVCVEVDRVASYDQWVSVIVVGRYEELPETPVGVLAPGRLPEQSDSRQKDRDQGEGRDNEAWQFLKTHPMWQEPGSAAWALRGDRNSVQPLAPVFYRIRIDRVTGHAATADGIQHAISSVG